MFDLSKRHCYYFNEICKIPHGSRNEKALSDYIVGIAKSCGLKYIQDDLNNVIVYKEGTNGSNEAVIIQAHMDMVPEKNKDSNHDFFKDPLDLYIEDGFLKARGTTLGADDGHGVAYMLSIMEDKSLKHPPLELVFTTEEEIGLFGALNLKKEYFSAQRLISLDGGGESRTLLSSAGGAKVELMKTITFEANDLATYALEVKGLKGGHSGGAIDLERGNANKILVRVLKELQLSGVDVTLATIDGGLKDNAIPREAYATFVSKSDATLVMSEVENSFSKLKVEYEASDEGLMINCKSVDKAKECFNKEVSDTVINALYLAINGFIARSMQIKGLTLTSLNMGVIKVENSTLTCTYSLRSAIDSCVDNLINQLSTLASVFGFSVETGSRYPGWNYNPVSKMRDILKVVVKDELDKELEVVAAHGGTEVGVFSAMIPNIDVVSMGPFTEDIHTPDERMDLASFDRVDNLLKKFIEKL